MSCYWDIYCKTCDECLVDCNVNHGEEDLLRVCLDVIPRLIGLAKLLPGLEVSLESLGVFSTCGNERFLRLGILIGHEDHVILPKNEYGAYVAECGESRKCPTCGGEVICRAKRGHPGDHELFNRYVSSKDRQR